MITSIFSDICTEYLKSIKGRVADSTIATYRYRLNVLERELRAEDISELDAEVIQRVIDSLYGDYMPKTVHAIFDVFRAVLEYAKDEGIISRNLCEEVKLRLPDKPRKRICLSNEESRKFFTLLKSQRDIFFPVYIGCQTGLGRSEVLGIKWKDVDFQKQQIVVEKNIITNDRENVVKSKRVPMTKELSATLILEKGMRTQKMNNIENDYVCQTVTRCVMKPEYFDRRFRMFVGKNKNQFPENLQFKDLVRSSLSERVSDMLSDNAVPYESFIMAPFSYIEDKGMENMAA